MVLPAGLEPATFWVETKHSIQLSYESINFQTRNDNSGQHITLIFIFFQFSFLTPFRCSTVEDTGAFFSYVLTAIIASQIHIVTLAEKSMLSSFDRWKPKF